MNTHHKWIIRSVMSAQEEEKGCDAFEQQIPAYVECELDGLDARTEFPALAEHLALCPDCFQVYMDLRDILELDQKGELPSPTKAVQYDLSFLPAPDNREARLWAPAANAWRFLTELRIVFAGTLGQFHNLPISAHLEWATVDATRSTDDATQEREQILTLPSPDQDITLQLIVGPRQQNGQGHFGLRVVEDATGHFLPRVRITLRDEENRLLASKRTPDSGRVDFGDLGPGAYLIEVKREETVWQLPLTFHVEEGSGTES